MHEFAELCAARWPCWSFFLISIMGICKSSNSTAHTCVPIYCSSRQVRIINTVLNNVIQPLRLPRTNIDIGYSHPAAHTHTYTPKYSPTMFTGLISYTYETYARHADPSLAFMRAGCVTGAVSRLRRRRLRRGALVCVRLTTLTTTTSTRPELACARVWSN